MEWREHIRCVVSSVGEHPRRVFASGLGVFAGSTALVLLLAWGSSFGAALGVELSRYGRQGLFVFPGVTSSGFPGYRDGVRVRVRREDVHIAEISNTETIEAVIANHRGRERRLVEAEGRVRRLDTDGTDPRFPRYRNFELAAGRFFDSADQARSAPMAVLGYEAAGEFFDPPESGVGRSIRIDGVPFEVVGIFEEKEGRQYFNTNRPDNRLVLIPSASAEARLGVDPEDLNFFLVFPRPGVTAATALDAFVTSLAARRGFHPDDEDAMPHFDMSRINAMMAAVTTAFTIFVGFAGAITLIVGGVGIANYQQSVLEERSLEIAVAKALGARSRTLAFQAALEAASVAGCAAVAGTALAAALCAVLRTISPDEALMSPHISAPVLVFSGFAFTAVALTSALAPARRVARQDVSAALRGND